MNASVSEERKRKVLIADDDEDQRYLLSRVLQRAGFATVAVETGGEVLPAARIERPDAILLDVQMPDQDGFVTARALKADPLVADVPIVFLTGHADAHDRLQGEEIGAAAYLLKSTIHTELVGRLRTLCGVGGASSSSATS